MPDFTAVYAELYAQLAGTPLAGWLDKLPGLVAGALAEERHGRMPEWSAALGSLPPLTPSTINLDDGIQIGQPGDAHPEQLAVLQAAVQTFIPWRKGPFHLFGLHIDTEWRSDWKWNRVKEAVGEMHGRMVLDVGCGNGYYGWRMVGAGARLVVGLDPYLLYVLQYQAVHRYLPHLPNYVLPLGFEQLPPHLHAFDTTFSMGVLYHRRDPLAHLQELHGTLRPGGQLVLETLILDGQEGDLLAPSGRYAQMRNVWAIPSIPILQAWLEQSRFSHIEVVDVTPTTAAEQRSTAWMPFQSLPDFLRPTDPTRTVEGYPAPVRAVVTAVAS